MAVIHHTSHSDATKIVSMRPLPTAKECGFFPCKRNLCLANTETTEGKVSYLGHTFCALILSYIVFDGLDAPPTFKWLWKTKSMPQIKVFGWHLIMDSLNTKDMLQRRNSNVQSGTSCVLCHLGLRETRDRLFFDFAK